MRGELGYKEAISNDNFENTLPEYRCDTLHLMSSSSRGHKPIGSVHPSESSTIAAFRVEKGESQLDGKGNVVYF